MKWIEYLLCIKIVSNYNLSEIIPFVYSYIILCLEHISYYKLTVVLFIN